MSNIITKNANVILEKRYLDQNEEGQVIETPSGMFERVAINIASADLLYDKNYNQTSIVAKEFFDIMNSLKFLPNSPTLMNAGKPLQMCSACFVLPVYDSIEEIFDAIKNAAIIHRAGGGTGFDFSRIRPENSSVKSTNGIASGPISFMKVFNAATDVIKQGGKRRGASMAVLRCDHPDILQFIKAKEVDGAFSNFNFSVAITDKFIEAYLADEDYNLIDPHNNKVVQAISAKYVFNLIAEYAHKNGEPGMLFIDVMNKFNPAPLFDVIRATNPCGELPLFDYESCTLGSINLSKFVEFGKLNWGELARTIRVAVHFLDNVLDMNKYPLMAIEEKTKKCRKIGLGIMGFHDMLLKMGIRYDSQECLDTIDELGKFFNEQGVAETTRLAVERGPFHEFSQSIYKDEAPRRNASLFSIAPTGTISIIANCSSSIEPIFAYTITRNHDLTDGQLLIEVNNTLEDILRERGLLTDELLEKVAEHGSLQEVEGLPEDLKNIFVNAHDISPEWHIRVQAQWQKYIDSAISKTCNLPHDATVQDVLDIYMQAYNSGCKGVTVYRNGSRDGQVLYAGKQDSIEGAQMTIEEVLPLVVEDGTIFDHVCPACGKVFQVAYGTCAWCPECGQKECS